MFKDTNELQLALLYRALNTERNTINRLIENDEKIVGYAFQGEEHDNEEPFLLTIPDEVPGDPNSFRNQKRAVLQLLNEVDLEYMRRNAERDRLNALQDSTV